MAGKFNIGSDDEPIADINITPFVDVVLVLLVIFMVTANFIVNKGMKLELPKAASVEKLENQKTFSIAINQNGDLNLDGKYVNVEQLKNIVRKAKNSKLKINVLISADKNVIYNSVVSIMDVLRLEGVSDFALQLDPLLNNK